MTRDSARVATLLRVRRIQQQQSAAGLSERLAAVQEAEENLRVARSRYRDHHDLDRCSGRVAVANAQHLRRSLHAAGIPRQRAALAAAEDALERQRNEIADRTAAVRGIERLEERITADATDHRLRRERREVDERMARRSIGGSR